MKHICDDVDIRARELLSALWWALPLKVRQSWWKETSYSRHAPSLKFMARLPGAIAIAWLEREAAKRSTAADIAAAKELLNRARKAPCEACLRTTGCKERCLRDLFLRSTPLPDLKATKGIKYLSQQGEN
jgi:hypothetical protein